MDDRTSVIYGNPIDAKTIRRAEKSKRKYLKKYGDDTEKDYPLSFVPVETLDFLGVKNIVAGKDGGAFPDNALIVGNIRMGFGHYRISIAMASCAKALGYEPYWLDLASFDATGSKMIRSQNDLYSLASQISQKSKLFNKFYWEPLNSEGFKKLTYNAKDQKNSELLVPLFRHIPKDIPYIATHVWPAQAAVHAGMTRVVNAVPDNWPMALHLAEGAVHAVQTPYAYFGYKTLNGFAKTPLRGMPESALKTAGCFVDHELLKNLENDNARRKARLSDGSPLRILMTVGGAGAGYRQFEAMAEHLLPYVRSGKAALFINFGDHAAVYRKMLGTFTGVPVHAYENRYGDLKALAAALPRRDAEGVYAVCSGNIFEAVYSTNLLMPECDLLVTKPSELAYYPVPKLFMRHIGGHEVYGAINGREYGDAAGEFADTKEICAMLDRLLTDKEILAHLCDTILRLRNEGRYDGAYECVRLAAGIKK